MQSLTAKKTANAEDAGGLRQAILESEGHAIELQRTSMDACGCQVRGLQNRLRGAVRRPGWIRFPSIPARFGDRAR